MENVKPNMPANVSVECNGKEECTTTPIFSHAHPRLPNLPKWKDFLQESIRSLPTQHVSQRTVKKYIPFKSAMKTYFRETDIKYKHSKTNFIIYRAKKRNRSEFNADDWGKQGYAFTDVCEKLSVVVDTIPKIHRKDIRITDFIQCFDSKCLPVIIQGCMEHWPARTEWTFEKLEKRFRYCRFRIGDDDNGKSINLEMKYYIDYLKCQMDDSPLYLFDANVEESVVAKIDMSKPLISKKDRLGCQESYSSCESLLDDWEIPDVFPHDLYMLLGEQRRPPYRWFCVGPKRSGTTLHIDPLGTAAWNALVSGCKRWILFPPSYPKDIVTGRFFRMQGEDKEAITWFDKILPRILKHYPDMEYYEVIQTPGEVIYVPPLWWHAVLNLSDSISCTQNFVSLANFDIAWTAMRRDRPHLSVFWLSRIEKFFPQLHALALESNRQQKYYIEDGKIIKDGEDVSSESSDSDTTSFSSDIDDELHSIYNQLSRPIKYNE